MRVVIVPGNGSGDVEESNWYGWLRDKLTKVQRRVSIYKALDTAHKDTNQHVDLWHAGPILLVFTLFTWYLQDNVECLLKNMPDPIVARESVWLPFMEKELCCGEDTIIVGHSSGAQAAMRFAEKHKVHGIVLVSACVTDLGDANEAASGYYNRPWQWTQMRDNTQWIVQFGSTDDPFIPFDEQKEVANGTNAEFHQYTNKGHFMEDSFPKLLEIVMKKVNA